MPRPRRLRPSSLALLPLAALCAVSPARAQPWSLTASQAFTHDSNLYRAPDGPGVASDTISTTGLKLGLEQPLGRQRLLGSVSAAHNRFRSQSQLDNNSHALDLRLNWETIGRLSGDLRYGRNRRLANFADTRTAALVTARNLVTTEDLSGRVQYGLASTWVLEAGAGRREQSYSAPEFRSRAIEQDSLSIGAHHRPSDLLSVGVTLRDTEGRNPDLVLGGQSNRYDRSDIDLVATWRYSGLTTLNGRISRTSTDHSLARQRDFEGTTGALNIDYRPTGRTSLNLQLSRETNDESAFAFPEDDNNPTTPPPETPLVDAPLVDSRLTDSLRLRVAYQLTGKITLDAGLGEHRRRLQDAVLPAAGGTPVLVSGRDRTRVFSFGAVYSVNRAVQLGCSVGRERRSVEAASAVTAPFHANIASCQAQFTLR